MKLTGAEILVECLKEQGVDTVFGYPGGQVLFIYDALYKYQKDIRHILTSHEQGAAHAADGYARATGKVGVCIATSGPGATNLVTGIATAYLDSVPIVAITGQVPTNLLGKDSFQEVDIIGITMPITKHSFMVKDIRVLADTVRRAFAIAKQGRPGPVLIDICKDVTAATWDYEPMKPGDLRRYQPEKFTETARDLSDAEVSELAEVINRAQKPILISGGGVSIADACDELRAIAEKTGMPVTTTLMGLGSFPGTHELFTGLIGMHGTKTTNLATSQADLILAVGTRFSDRVVSKVDRFAPRAKIIHIDIDAAEIGKNVRIDYPVIGDIKKILAQLLPKLNSNTCPDWTRQIKKWKETYRLRYDNSDGKLKPQYVIERLFELTGGDALITTEVGQHQIWAAQYFKYTSPRQFISSGGLGTMGYGLGASIGAKLGRPDKRVINVAGDGSFRMNCNELATAVEYRVPVIIALINNHVLGMVRQWQNLFYGGRYSQSTIDRGTNFVALAEAYGAVGINVKRPEEVDPAIKRALEVVDRPVVINFDIDMDDKVFPIVPPGAPIDELIDGTEAQAAK